jgi:dipeptidyl-peptidase-4
MITYFMKRFAFLLLVAVMPVISFAQQKTFSFKEIFGGEFPTILQPLPQIKGWIDDRHYIESRTQNGQESSMSVDVLTGNTIPHVPSDTQPAIPDIQDAQNVTISPDRKYVAFTRKNNLYIRDISGGTEKAITSDGSDVILNGYASWVYYEEILGRRSNYRAFWWSPDSKSIAYMRFDDSQVPIFPIYFAEGQHGYLEQQRYPKAGDKNPQVKVGIAAVADGKTTWAQFNAADDQYFGTPYWTPANELLVQWMNRAQDTLILYQVNKSSGVKKQLYTETQPTWITLDDDNRFYFLKNNSGFIIKSDKDDWQNLYLHGMDGKLLNKLTTGNYWGTNILTVDENAGVVYFSARKENSARFDVYKVPLKGGTVTRLTSGDFSYDAVQMSPGGKYFIGTYSNLSTPPAMAIFDNKGKTVRQIGKMATASMSSYAIPVSRMIKVKSSDGLFDLPMVVTYPVNFDSTKKYPVWISVYGGPDYGLLFDRWKPVGGLTQWWAQEGVIQVTMDNRSSGHFGKKGIAHIFKQLGKWETEDYISGARWLASQPWVDRSKIGITGGSFGGYVTCMALTYGADVFTHGIAVSSVTDWSLYDTHYTERFMRTPASNPDGYKNTSVIAHIDNYKGVLRIVHGTTDDNVHMQNSIQLINALQDKRKRFEFMLYPNQRHGISGNKAAHSLLETVSFIYRHMLQKEMPKEFGF